MTEVVDLVEALESGQVIGMPTDTVYGLIARAEDPAGYERLFTLKGRDRSKPIALLVRDLDQALGLVADADGILTAVSKLWPGPLTVVGTRADGAAAHLGDDRGTIGVRCPDDPVLISLIERCGPLAASSANRAGQSTLSGAEAVRHEFGDSLAVVADGDRVRNHASTVIDVSVKPWKLLRSGPITSAEIEALLG